MITCAHVVKKRPENQCPTIHNAVLDNYCPFKSKEVDACFVYIKRSETRLKWNDHLCWLVCLLQGFHAGRPFPLKFLHLHECLHSGVWILGDCVS